MLFKYATFDDLAAHPDVVYIPPSTEPEPEIHLPHLCLLDTPDDLIILPGAIGVAGVSFVWQDFWISDSVLGIPPNWRDVPWLPGRYDLDNNTIDIPEELITPHRQIDEPTLAIDAVSSKANFGHFVHDTLPYARVARRARALIPGLCVKINDVKFQNQRRLFSAVFDESYDSCVGNIGNAKVAKLVLARRQNQMFGNPWKLPFAGLRHARDQAIRNWRLNDIDGHSRPLRLYLHRFQDLAERQTAGLLYGRNFSNIDDLLIGLLGQGFIAIEPGRSNIEDIAPLLARAECVVSLHGAGLANTLFCAPGTRVFEVRSHEGNWRSLEALSAALGHCFMPVNQPVPPDGEVPYIDVEGVANAVAA